MGIHRIERKDPVLIQLDTSASARISKIIEVIIGRPLETYVSIMHLTPCVKFLKDTPPYSAKEIVIKISVDVVVCRTGRRKKSTGD